MKKDSVQQSLFGVEKNRVSLEDYKKSVSKKPKQHEKVYMNSLIKTATSMDLPCIHIEYFCGNKFYPTCKGTRFAPHKETRAICPCCGKPVLATCINRINKGLAGHYDIIGVEWAIESKHKINKGKQVAKPSIRQSIKELYYDCMGVPNIIVNESDEQIAFNFLKTLHNSKFPERII